MSSNIRVIVVDDDPEVLSMMEDFLGVSGYQTHCYGNAPDAIKGLEKLIASDAPEKLVVISDINMPIMSGTELLSHMTGQHPTIPVILMTACAQNYASKEIQKMGAFAFMTKPFGLQHMTEVLKSLPLSAS